MSFCKLSVFNQVPQRTASGLEPLLSGLEPDTEIYPKSQGCYWGVKKKSLKNLVCTDHKRLSIMDKPSRAVWFSCVKEPSLTASYQSLSKRVLNFS